MTPAAGSLSAFALRAAADTPPWCAVRPWCVSPPVRTAGNYFFTRLGLRSPVSSMVR